MPLSTQECNWIPANCHGNLRKCWGYLCWISIASMQRSISPSGLMLQKAEIINGSGVQLFSLTSVSTSTMFLVTPQGSCSAGVPSCSLSPALLIFLQILLFIVQPIFDQRVNFFFQTGTGPEGSRGARVFWGGPSGDWLVTTGFGK